jgi:hypothetical protein
MDDAFIFGYPDECAAFGARNIPFMQCRENLWAAVRAADDAKFAVDGKAERNVVLLCRLAREDFMEILLLAAHGYGIGATKLLRGLYENVVTAYYLLDHPEKAQDFEDYGLILVHKLTLACEEIGFAAPECFGDLARRARDMWDARKDLHRHWSEGGFRGVVRSVAQVKSMLPVAYTEPSSHVHPSIEAIRQRVTIADDGTVFDGSCQPREADNAMMWAHALLLHSLGIYATVGKLPELEELLTVCKSDWVDAWPNADNPGASGSTTPGDTPAR